MTFTGITRVSPPTLYSNIFVCLSRMLGRMAKQRWCGFDCLRLTLCFINTLYLIQALLLIAVVVIVKGSTYFTEPRILIGVLVCGIFLFVLAVVGFVGTINHHQVILFVYMLLLSISGVVMFSVSVAALALADSQVDTLLKSQWTSLDSEDKSYLQDQLNCCGFDKNTTGKSTGAWGHPPCNTTTLTRPHSCCAGYNESSSSNSSDVGCPHCQPCYQPWRDTVVKGLKASGGIGVIFSFTQIAGVVAAFFYRNFRDPNVNLKNYL